MSNDRSASTFDPTAVPIRDASTVMLVRDSARGVEVFLQRRVVGMDFAGGMTVFPGGGVDPSDTDAEVRWTGPDVAWWAERFGIGEAQARALVLAAVRETFEECGVLLAGPTADSVVADTGDYAEARRLLEARELSFGDFLEKEQLVLRADLLRPQANWITPLGERRRYDTRFFVAAVPEGQRADGNTSETDLVQWQTAEEALADWRSGRCILLPPTWSQLSILSGFATVADLMAADPVIEPILPIMSRRDGAVHIAFDGDEGYYEVGTHPWAQRSDI
ncbi:MULTISPECIES: NUDIX hydrolase [Rhodococcus]|uniref:NUDIX domain-containing protein n=1 Tax=Rhodococcus rhodochrous TaxID=1829 RepID=A0AAW4XCX8_RHORH|nr:MULTISPECIES: NUDIX domain-containing protein [Rhodococcus]MCD2110893.1 NUDIX domain-containing protein [Rhodococcus rhodochrous]QHG82934.1 NUDIX hydrolase [Rhodococcus rhodochrous]QOH57385.1 NUDIX hydrolase [Rhodococcus rhodochrous]WAL44995.1 NUDIX domain-containing protein [Rhodococcus pyridinivorans]